MTKTINFGASLLFIAIADGVNGTSLSVDTSSLYLYWWWSQSGGKRLPRLAEFSHWQEFSFLSIGDGANMDDNDYQRWHKAFFGKSCLLLVVELTRMTRTTNA